MKGTITRYQFSKIIEAPLSFVYDWCTDYREDDPKITGAKLRRLIIEKKKDRAVFVNQHKSAKAGTVINVVTLRPPDGWHLHLISEKRDGTGEYHLSKLGPRRTKLRIYLRFKWKTAQSPTRIEFQQHLKSMWDKYAAALERDYMNNKL